jgi:hypothetical protein
MSLLSLPQALSCCFLIFIRRDSKAGFCILSSGPHSVRSLRGLPVLWGPFTTTMVEPVAFLWISARHVRDDPPALHPAAADLAVIVVLGWLMFFWFDAPLVREREPCGYRCYVIMQLLPSLSLQNIFIRAIVFGQVVDLLYSVASSPRWSARAGKCLLVPIAVFVIIKRLSRSSGCNRAARTDRNLQ